MNIHLKVDYQEAIILRKEMLICQKECLGAIKFLRNYAILRKAELAYKEKVKRNLSALHLMIHNFDAHLPRKDIELIEKKESQSVKAPIEEIKKIKEVAKNEETYTNDIDAQIAAISSKLKELV